MKVLPALLAIALTTSAAWATRLVPSTLDPALEKERAAASIPWSTPEESGKYWRELSSSHVPIYNQHKDGNLSRDLYIPQPGIGYWVLGGISEEEFFATHKEKLKIKDTLISADVYKNEYGKTTVWALWAPESQAYKLTEPMKKYGIGQARVEYSPIERLIESTKSFEAISGLVLVCSLLLNLLFLGVIILFLLYKVMRRPVLGA